MPTQAVRLKFEPALFGSAEASSALRLRGRQYRQPLRLCQIYLNSLAALYDPHASMELMNPNSHERGDEKLDSIPVIVECLN